MPLIEEPDQLDWESSDSDDRGLNADAQMQGSLHRQLHALAEANMNTEFLLRGMSCEEAEYLAHKTSFQQESQPGLYEEEPSRPPSALILMVTHMLKLEQALSTISAAAMGNQQGQEDKTDEYVVKLMPSLWALYCLVLQVRRGDLPLTRIH